MRVSGEADWGCSDFIVVGGMVWWICVGQLCCAEEFAEESLTELTESQRIETFSGRIFMTGMGGHKKISNLTAILRTSQGKLK